MSCPVSNPQHDYVGLVKLLPLLHQLVDATGEVHLTEEESARIRALGFAAHAGKWHVPPLPPELVADNDLLRNLSLGWIAYPPPQILASGQEISSDDASHGGLPAATPSRIWPSHSVLRLKRSSPDSVTSGASTCPIGGKPSWRGGRGG